MSRRGRTGRRNGGQTGFEQWGGYMNSKIQKLEKQFEAYRERELNESADGSTGVFDGVAVFVNGHTDPTGDEIKRIMANNGGTYHHYQSSRTTHVIASNLPYAKVRQLKGGEKIVKPEWISDSLKEGRLLDYREYLLYPNAAHTVAATNDNNFLSGFYAHSRLHLISTLAASLKEYVNQLKDGSTEFPGRVKLSGSGSAEAVVAHIDMDCFFVSVGLRSRPDLRGKPVAVTHSKSANAEDDSTSSVSSCSYEARQAGVKNGMFLGQALKLCPGLQTIKYDFNAYETVSRQLYDIVCGYTHQVEAVSCDEMYIDCSEITGATGVTADEFVSVLRADIESETGCTASVGLGPNRMVARLATKQAKPNGKYRVEDVDAFMLNQKASELPGVGYSTSRQLRDMGVETCADLQKMQLSSLQREFGPKVGENLHNMCRGVDTRPVETRHERKSVSAEVNYAIRLSSQEEADEFMQKLSGEVASRIAEINRVARCITLKLKVRAKDAPVEPYKYLGHGKCDNISKSANLHSGTADVQVIAKEVIRMLHELNVKPEDLRGIGIQLTQLESAEGKQTRTIMDYVSAKPSTSTDRSPRRKPVPLPTLSQLDPDVMSELPPELQAEIRAEYGPKKPPVSKATAPRSIWGVMTKAKKGKSPVKSAAKLDPEVMAALPPHIQEEIRAEYLQDKSEPAIPAAAVDPDETSAQSSEPAEKQEMSAAKAHGDKPNLCGATEVKDIRSLLQEWVSSTDSPLEEDRIVIRTFLAALVPDDIYKAHTLIKSLHRYVTKQNNPAWFATYKNVTQHVQVAMIEKHGMELKVPMIINSK